MTPRFDEEDLDPHEHLTPEERLKVRAQVSYFVAILSAKYKVSPEEVVEVVQAMRRRKIVAEKARWAGIASMIGLAVSALGTIMWQGLGSLISVMLKGKG